jgi:transcriptional antiterminator NusG
VTSDTENTTESLPPEGEVPQVPVPRAETELPAPRTPSDLESVENERQVGPTDITGFTDQPSPEGRSGETASPEMPAHPVAGSAAAQTAPKQRAAAEAEEDEKPVNRQWYILKVQTNREESIRDALQRRVAMAGLEQYFGPVIVPTEMISEFKGGKKRVSKRKLYPGYIVVNMEINDDTWYLVRETSGIGDFTGAMGRPTPMAQQDVEKIVATTEEKPDEAPRVDIRFKPADRVRIKEGTFENFEGNVEAIDHANGRVTVMINIFGRSTPVELEYWQIEAV